MIRPDRSDRISGSEPDLEGLTFSTLKTLFLILDSGVAIRNILRTDAYRVLKNCRNLRIVIFSPLSDEEFAREVGGENVIIESLQKWRAGPLIKTLRSLRKDVWSDKYDLARFREKRRSNKSRLGRALAYRLFRGGDSNSRVDRAFQAITRWEEKLWPSLGGEYFDKYRPDLIFYSTIYSQNLSLELGARQRDVKSCAYIVSWDNPTTKGPFPVRPNSAIVWNNVMRDELLDYHDFTPEEVFVSGPPQFDLYFDRSKYLSRNEFFRKWGLDPEKRLITYTTGTVSLLPLEHENVELIYERTQNGAFRQPSQLLLRLHPKYDYERFKRFENRPGLVLQLPGRRGKTDDSWNPSREDMFELGETMLHSDVVVNIASTITIDAACFDTPVVNVAFDGVHELPYLKSSRRIYDFNHYQKIVRTGGVKIANDIDEAVRYIQRYLDDPTLEAEGRARIVREQCCYFDGRCGRRIANYLLRLLGPGVME